MFLSLDFGGSTLDVVLWDKSMKIQRTWSYESEDFRKAKMEEILGKLEVDWGKVGQIYATGGKTYFWINKYQPIGVGMIPVKRVDEIEAIGRGGFYLWQRQFKDGLKDLPILVVSMGTGTCMVKVSRRGQLGKQPRQHVEQASQIECLHIGGTGIGGGTFLGLARELLKETEVEKLVDWFKKGRKEKVDLSVRDIVGRNIGIIPADLTASNLGRLSREIEFEREDLAAGMVNLIGQTIAMVAVFAAKSEGISQVVLTGKLTRIEPILGVVKKIGRLYGIKFVKPKRAEIVGAVGAGVW